MIFKKLVKEIKKQTNSSAPIKYQNMVFQNDVEREMYENNVAGYRELRDGIDYQDSLLKIKHDADQQYEIDNDIDKLISVYEYVFLQCDPPLITSSDLALGDLYQKNNQNDKAWSYYNYLLQGKLNTSREHIRFAQAKLLKKEKKYLEAIRMYCFGYVTIAQDVHYFNENKFIKEIGVCGRKLGWTPEMIAELATLIKSKAINKRYSESSFNNDFKIFLSNHVIEENKQ